MLDEYYTERGWDLNTATRPVKFRLRRTPPRGNLTGREMRATPAFDVAQGLEPAER